MGCAELKQRGSGASALNQRVQDIRKSSQSFVAAKRQQNPALLVNKASQDAAAGATALTGQGILSFRLFLLPKAKEKSTFAPSPSTTRASAFALHLRTAAACRLAVSATGGARKLNPSEGGEAATAARHRFASVRKGSPNYSFSLP